MFRLTLTAFLLFVLIDGTSIVSATKPPYDNPAAFIPTKSTQSTIDGETLETRLCHGAWTEIISHYMKTLQWITMDEFVCIRRSWSPKRSSPTFSHASIVIAILVAFFVVFSVAYVVVT